MTRRADDHVHPEYWTGEAHNRFEDRVTRELHELRAAVTALTLRLTVLLSVIGFLAFLIPILAPYLRRLFGL